MIIVNLMGGLGNQMFQYAFAVAKSNKNHGTLKLNISSFAADNQRDYELGLFAIDAAFASKKEVAKLDYKKKNFLQKLVSKSTAYYPEPHYHFDKNALNIQGDVYFNGYWQSEKYFKAYRDDLLRKFTLKKQFSQKTKQYQQAIQKYKNTKIQKYKNTKIQKSVSLHIRRGDYVINPKVNNFHGTCSLDYYKNAVAKIKEHINNPQLFIFSDDLPWTKANLDFDNMTFVELEATTPDHEAMALMSLCQHNIIANSSFSWWGAWLNQNPDKIVIAPKKWFNNTAMNTQDLIPNTWIRL